MAKWFITVGQEERGPVEDPQLRRLATSGRLKTTDLVRREGMDRPVEAGKIKGLFPAAPASPRAATPQTSSSAPKSSPESAGRVPSRVLADSAAPEAPRRRWPMKVGLALLAFYLMGMIGRRLRPVETAQEQATAAAKASAGASAEPSASDAVEQTIERVRRQIQEEAGQYLPEWEKFLTACDELQSLLKDMPQEFEVADKINSNSMLAEATINEARVLPLSYEALDVSNVTVAELFKADVESAPRWIATRAKNEEKLLQLMKDIDSVSNRNIDNNRNELATLTEEGPPQLQKPQETDWSDPYWNKFSKRELDRIKQEVRSKQEHAAADAVVEWEQKKKDYESNVARLESAINKERDKLRESVATQLKPLQESLTATPTAEILDRYGACTAQLKQLLERLDSWKQLLEDQEPEPLNGDLKYVGGFTHLIEGDDHYVDKQVIVIPKEFRSLYYGGATGPNEVLVEGAFRFIGNVKGRNAFGATINVEKYECDREYSLSLKAQERYADGVADLSKALNNLGDRDHLARADGLLRTIVGDAKYQETVREHAVLAAK